MTMIAYPENAPPARGRSRPKTERNCSKGLEDVQEVARSVMEVAQLVRNDQVFDALLAGGGLGALYVAALVGAVKRVGPWPVIDHLGQYLQSKSSGQSWGADAIEWLRSGELSFQLKDKNLAATIQESLVSKIASHTAIAEERGDCWSEICLLHIAEFAAWTEWARRPEESSLGMVESTAASAGLAIAQTLDDHDELPVMRELLASLNALTGAKPAKPARRRRVA